MVDDFISKKQKVLEVFTNYIEQKISKQDFTEELSNFLEDPTFIQVELFKKIFEEILTYREELSLKDIKQRKLMLESFIY